MAFAAESAPTKDADRNGDYRRLLSLFILAAFAAGKLNQPTTSDSESSHPKKTTS